MWPISIGYNPLHNRKFIYTRHLSYCFDISGSLRYFNNEFSIDSFG
nr:MAG TPA: hypothetical protein [Bacteriophage sp.]